MPEPTITLELTAAETAVLLNSSALAIAVITANRRSAAAVLPDTIDAFEELGAEKYQALVNHIATIAGSAFFKECDVVGINMETGEEVPNAHAA